MGYLHYNFPSEIKAFSTDREGGRSKGAYATFNCNNYCGDSLIHVNANKELLCSDWNIKPERLFIPRQVHGTEIAVIDEGFWESSISERKAFIDGVDALISPLTDCCLCVSTADCIPILLYDTDKHVIAAIHAGWRGTVAHIVSLTLQAMNKQFGTLGRDIVASIGPGISLSAFEVGEEVYEAFELAGFSMEHIACRYEKWHIDLWEANRIQLLEGGVSPECIELAGICTYKEPERFFSARKLGIHSGRILTGIMRTEEMNI